MDIRTRLDGDDMHVALEGRLDAAWSGTVGKTLQETLLAGCHSVVLDLERVSYLSSAGIRVLMLLAKQLKGIGGRLHIAAQSAQVKEVLEMVGFHRLIDPLPAGTYSPAAAATVPAINWSWGEQDFEIHTLVPDAVQQGTIIGSPPWIKESPTRRPGSVLRLTPGVLALGLGAIGPVANPERAGELLAVNGLAIALPSDDPAHPDWLAREGALVPDISLLYGLTTAGDFRELLRFGENPGAPAVTLSALAEAVLERCAAQQAVLVAVAETASLVGAALQTPPTRLDSSWFAFPGVRDRLLFTAEPAHASTTCLIVGVVAREPESLLGRLLRPMNRNQAIHAHCHAAVAPYRPVHKGRIALQDTLDALLESQTLLGVLHLLHDSREGVGAGESHLRRGAVWCAPVQFSNHQLELPT